MSNILVYGCGAIGRWLPRCFPEHQFFYEDTNGKIMGILRKRKSFITWATDGQSYDPFLVKVPKSIPENIEAIFCCVGQRNFLSLSERFMRTSVPIVCLENDRRLPAEMRHLTGNQNIFFGIPDVIASSTAPPELLAIHPLSNVAEYGTLYIEDGFEIPGSYQSADPVRMRKEWLAKLYIHNTPHCVAAYLGWQAGKKYLHEAMQVDKIVETVDNLFFEMIRMVMAAYGMDDEEYFVEYAVKEKARFTNPMLFDPIERVAREPLRKLALSERLIGAAMLCDQKGIYAPALYRGIDAAIHYGNQNDPDFRLMRALADVPLEEFVKNILHIEDTEPIYDKLIDQLKHSPFKRFRREKEE